ncbi:MAG: hypothetical protein N2596_04050 [Syntrophorhabdaceae bacterium]|nr:hypothetical protein [Syntrophorhabdaceae bacterium]
MNTQVTTQALELIREIIGILMESNNYFKLNLKERRELLKYFIINNLIITGS